VKGSPISNPRVNRQISAYAHAGVACMKLFIFHFTSSSISLRSVVFIFKCRTDSVRISHPSGSRLWKIFDLSRPWLNRPRKPLVPRRVQVFNV